MGIEEFFRKLDVCRNGLGRSYHIRAKRGELSGYVMTCGSRERVLLARELLENSRLVSDNRGLTVCTGFYRGAPVTLHCTGMGPASAEIAFTELLFNIDLLRFRRPTIIRAGTAVSWSPRVGVGEFVVELGVVRNESTSAKIAPVEWPATTDLLTNLVIAETSLRLGLGNRLWFGISICKDTLYADEDPEARSAVTQKVRGRQRAYEEMGAASASMESAPLAMLTDFYNKKLRDLGAGVRLGLSSVLLIVSPYYAEAEVEFKVPEEAEVGLVRLALESLARKHQLDGMYLEGRTAPPLDIHPVTRLLYERTL